MEGLFNPTSILFHVINAMILFTALYFLLYKPVNRYMQNRQDAIAKEIDDAHALLESANAAMAEHQAEMSAVDQELALKTLEEQALAKESAGRILAAARQEAERIIQDSKDEAEKMTAQNQQAMHEFAVSLALDVSTKMLGREVTREDHLRLIDEFLNEVE